jgi:glycosyltransferase involved in cell wall biosynthesis
MAERPADHATISVVIPTRNRAERLRSAIDSVRCQTRSPLEIIVVDDGSEDETADLLRQMAAPNLREMAAPTLRVIRNEQQRGAGHARNLGVSAAQGNLLAFLDDDDRWRPNKLATQAAALNAAGPRVGMVCCAYDVIAEPSGRRFKTWHPPDRPMDLAYFLRTTGFMTTVPMLRRVCFEQVGGFDEGLEGGQDLDLWIRIAEQFEVIAVPDVLAEHRIHGRQITTDLPAKARASAGILRKHRQRLAAKPDLLQRHLTRAALLHCAAGQAGVGQRYLAEALALAPDRQELRDHLDHSRNDPAGHAVWLRTHAFPSVEGIRLFY